MTGRAGPGRSTELLLWGFEGGSAGNSHVGARVLYPLPRAPGPS
jgi:hypothetical protein